VAVGIQADFLVSEAEPDVVRLVHGGRDTHTSDVENLGGWLTTVVARVSLDMLRSRRSRREEPLGGQVEQDSCDSC
jgi:DNA-directed RNA polymerase specialized sigma24 family protein